MKRIVMAAFLLACAALAGCRGEHFKMAQVSLDESKHQVLGEATGGRTGIMLFQFIPIGHNNKIRDAVRRAIDSKGGDDMIDIEVQESWWWAWIMNGYRVEVRGTVIKRK